MKLAKLSLSLFALALLGSSAAVAGDSNKTTLNLYEKVTVDGKQLNPGHYTVAWEGSGPDVKVTILQGKQTVATSSGHIVEQTVANTATAYGSETGPDGSRALETIYVGGKHTALHLTQQSAQQPSTTSSSK
jgi:hypothetical protein